jgi:hypothetical protein
MDNLSTVTHGHIYTATVNLSWIESFSTNDHIMSLLLSAGFTNVSVIGDGATRRVSGVWSGQTMTGEVDPHLTGIEDITVGGNR